METNGESSTAGLRYLVVVVALLLLERSTLAIPVADGRWEDFS